MSWSPVLDRFERGRFDDRVHAGLADVQRARDAVRRSGAAAMLDAWDASDRRKRDKFHRGGRSPWLTYEQVLVLRHLCSLYGHLSYDSITSLLCWGMDRECWDELGIEPRPGDTPSRVAGRVYASCKRLESVIDPHPPSAFFKRRYRHKGAALDAYKKTLHGADVEARKDRAGRFANAFIHISWLLTPEHVRERFRGNVVTDSTYLAAPARGHAKAYGPDTWVSSDPFAGYYTREGDHADTDENRKATGVKVLSRLGWGYELTTVVACPNDPTREATFPAMILGIGLDAPGARPAELTVKALAFMREKGIPAGFLAGDRNYGNHPLPGKWALPLLDLGYLQLFDMRKDDLADVRVIDGAALLEGNLYCPLIAFNDHLVHATLDFRYGRKVVDPDTGEQAERRISWKEWQRLLKERAKYLLTPHGRPRADGTMRFRCPATGDNPTMTCALRRDPDADDGQFPDLRVPLPDYRGGFCNNRDGFATLKPTPRNAVRPGDPTWKPAPKELIVPRHVQRMQFGSPAWGAHYGTFRNIVESVNDTLKNRNAIRFETANARRARGYAATVVYAALAVLAYNLKRLARFLAKPPVLDRYDRGKDKPGKKRLRDSEDGYGNRFWSSSPPLKPDAIPDDDYDAFPEAA